MRWRSAGLALLPLILAPAGCDLEDIVADSARFREDFHYSYPLKPGGTLELESFNGSVEILGWEKDEVRITGQKYASTQADLGEVKIEVHAAPEAIRLRTLRPERRRGGMGAKYLLRVPQQVELERIATSNGSIRVEDVRGASRLTTSNGSITLRRIQGRLEARTSNASISADQLNGDLLLRTSNGSIRLERLEGTLEAVTSNGGVYVRLARPAARRPLRLETSNGSIELTLDAFEDNEIRALTSNGPVTLWLPESAKARLKAITSNSSIHSDLPVLTRTSGKNILEGEIGGGGPLIELSTSNSAIRVLRR